jgi:FkbM family methyltransferase
VTAASRLLPRRLLRYAARACSLAHAHAAETSLRVLDELVHGEHEIGVIGRFCDRAKLSIDVGAADGLYLKVMTKRSARCVAFEPNPMSFQRLEKCFPGTQLEACALSSTHGEAELRVPVVGAVPYRGFGTIERDNVLSGFDGGREVFRVALKTLDGFGFEPVGLIKIDVEGHEWDVIQGAARTIDRCRPTLMFEIEERHKKGNFARIVEFFEMRGYGVFFLQDRRLRDRRAFDFAIHQNPAGVIRPGVYYNNFFFLADPRGERDLIES